MTAADRPWPKQEEARREKIGGAKARGTTSPKTNGAAHPAIYSAVSEKLAGPGWLKDCQLNKAGEIIPNVANALTVLRGDLAWRGVVIFDQMRGCAVLAKPVPVVDAGGEPATTWTPRPLTDADVIRVQEWLQQSGIRHVGRDTVFDALDLVARENAFHPIRAYLAKLKWDGVLRLDSWLIDFLGVEDDAAGYARAVGQMFLISMVARVESPGCKADYMLVLEGPQGALKSTACRVIAGDHYFSDGLPGDVAGKDATLHLRGKWVVEMSEMHSLTRSETTALKGFLSRAVDIYRPPYGRLEVHEPRQGVLIGTTNQDAYLKDETGGRRFWPVKCGTIRIDELTAARDQLFAEALLAYRAGAHWWPDAEFEQQKIKPQQAARFLVDEWTQPVEAYLEDADRVTVLEIAQGPLKIEINRLGTADQRRIAAILKSLGWRQGKRANKFRWWVPP